MTTDSMKCDTTYIANQNITKKKIKALIIT